MECLLCHAYCILYVILWITFPFPLAIFYPCYFQWGLISWVFNNNFSFDRLETITTFLVLAKKKESDHPGAVLDGNNVWHFVFLPFSFFNFFFNCSSFSLVGELCNWIMKLSLCKRLPLFQKLIRFWSIAINKLLFILVNPFRLFEANFDPFRRLTSPQKQNNITWAVSKNPDNEEPIPTRTKIAGPSQISSWVVVLFV